MSGELGEREPSKGADPAARAESGEAPSAPVGPPARETTGQRQQTVDLLCEAFANDELDVREFERRIEVAHRARTSDELRDLLTDLSTVRLPAPVGAAAPAPAPRAEHVRRPREPGGAGDVDLVVGIMGGASRAGQWTPARRSYALAVMGGVTLDFREARLPAGATEVFAFACWGGVEIVVPPGVEVDCSGIGIMGGFDDRREGGAPIPTGAPLLRIKGVALMGGVEITVRYPGESKGDARRRVRSERKGRLERGRRPEEER